MKKPLVLCAGMMLIASGAMAQGGALHMKWNACPNTAGASVNQDFSCNPLAGEVYGLFGTFTLVSSTPGVVAMDGFIDWLFLDSPDVPAFWQFQFNGCNEPGLQLVDARPAGICGTNNAITLCAPGGLACDAVITAYGLGTQVPALGGPNRSRLLMTLARSATSPVTLDASVAPAEHFAFNFNFYQDNAVGGEANECVGCQAVATATWYQAVFYNTQARAGEEGYAATLTRSMPGWDAEVRVNCAQCFVGNAKTTWGRLKSMYR